MRRTSPIIVHVGIRVRPPDAYRPRLRYNNRMAKRQTFLWNLIILITLMLTACGGEPGTLADPVIAVGTTDSQGIARVETDRGVVDIQVTSGLTGERLAGVRIRVADWAESRMVYAEDPTGQYLAVAAPFGGDTTVRRLVMPPRGSAGANITGADGPINLDEWEPVGTLSEPDLRTELQRGPDEAVLIYLFNPASPLALTGAALDAYRGPFDNVIALRAGGEPEDADLAMVIVPLGYEAYGSWEHRQVDRYLATRIGQRPQVNLNSDFAFQWSYPAFQVTPEEISFNEAGVAEVTLVWRSPNPNPPPPWSVFLTTDRDEVVAVEPEAVLIGPNSPSATFTLTLDQSALASGDYEVTIFLQPYSETFGLIEQTVELTTGVTVAERAPTPTPGPQVETLTVAPDAPREGDVLTIDATGFTPREAVLLEFVGSDFNVRDALGTADEDGAYHYELDLTTAPAGSYTLILSGTASEVSGETFVSVGERIADAVVNRTELNLRLGPSYDHPVIEILVSGDELEVIATNADDTWVEVTTVTGLTGWVVTDLIDLNIDLTTVPWNSNPPPVP